MMAGLDAAEWEGEGIAAPLPPTRDPRSFKSLIASSARRVDGTGHLFYNVD